MNLSEASNRSALELAESVAQAVRQRAGGRVRQLRVERVGDALLIRGESDSFYGLQLAIEAARPFLHANRDEPVRLAIEVGPAPVGP